MIPKPNVKTLLIPSMPLIRINTPIEIIAMEETAPKNSNLIMKDTANRIKAMIVMKNIKGTAIFIHSVLPSISQSIR